MSEAAAATPPSLRVGCPMWANRDWVGRWFPADTPVGHELATYSTWCTTVEGNTTFYATPPAETVRRWIEQAPASFRFCFKLPREITHRRRLRGSGGFLTDFLGRMDQMGQLLGPLQIQLPASFGPDDLPALDQFLSELPARFDWAVEVRNPAFFAGGNHERPLNDLLADRGVDRVTLDSRALFASPPVTRAEQEAWSNKPRLPVRPVATATHPLVRLIGQSDADASLRHWEPWVPKLAAWLEAGLEPYVFTHTPENLDAPDVARRLWARVADLTDSIAPLPEPQTAGRQLDFFDHT